MEEPLLQCDGLAVGYGARAVASGLSFSVGPGQCLCVVGENGTGKSTLLRTVLGLLPAVSGQVRFRRDVRPGDVGYLPQQSPLQNDFPATAREVVRSGCQSARGWRPFFRTSERRAADEALSRFGASACARMPYRELSGGQRQRVLLARALCAGRRMLVLDEPVTGLDPDAARELYGALAALRREGTAILSVTHDLPAGVADATHVLEIGPCGFFGTKAEWDAHCRERPGGVRHAVGSSLEDPHLLCAGDCLK